jgi:flagellar hook assembly protein FlgD
MVQPLPSFAEALITVDLPRQGLTSLIAYDIQGRLVRRIAAGQLAAGRHVVSWDGNDDQGVRVSSGVYFVRVLWPGGSSIARVGFVR